MKPTSGRAVYLEGLMAPHSIYPGQPDIPIALTAGAPGLGGRAAKTPPPPNADNYCAAQVYIDLYRLTPRPEMLTKTKATMNMLVNTPQVDDWTWIDAIQMACLSSPNSRPLLATPDMLRKPTRCIPGPATPSPAVFTTRKMACGGATPTLCPLQGAQRQRLLLVARQRLGSGRSRESARRDSCR